MATTKSDPWVSFNEINQDPWSKIRGIKKKTGKKIIGHILPDVPEELIQATGSIPVAAAGAGIAISLAQAQILSYPCNHAMGALELQLKGVLETLDGMIIPYVSDTKRNPYHLWWGLFPDVSYEFLRIPQKLRDPEANQ